MSVGHFGSHGKVTSETATDFYFCVKGLPLELECNTVVFCAERPLNINNLSKYCLIRTRTLFLKSNVGQSISVWFTVQIGDFELHVLFTMSPECDQTIWRSSSLLTSRHTWLRLIWYNFVCTSPLQLTTGKIWHILKRVKTCFFSHYEGIFFTIERNAHSIYCHFTKAVKNIKKSLKGKQR